MLISVAVIEYIVQPGDCLSSIADKHGFADWHTIYDHAANAEFRKQRPDPNLIYPGDKVSIPDAQPETFSVQTGQTSTFVVARPQTRLRLALEVDEATSYELVVAGERFSGSVSDATPFEHPIPCDATEAELTIWPASDEDGGSEHTWTLRIGHLHPIEKDSGVCGRLMNLGYYDADWSKPDQAAMSVGLRRFQVDEGLEPTGQLDDETRGALKKRHDG